MGITFLVDGEIVKGRGLYRQLSRPALLLVQREHDKTRRDTQKQDD